MKDAPRPTAKWKDELDLEGWSDSELDLALEVPAKRLALEGCRLPGDTLPVELHVHRSGLPGAYEYRFHGKSRQELLMTCVRCLADFGAPLELMFDLRFLPVSALPLDPEEEHEVLDGEVDIEYYRRPVFDLLSMVREQIYLALPMDPVCHEGCAGLCPHCGADRNKGAHECAGKPVDPRWQALLALKPQDPQ